MELGLRIKMLGCSEKVIKKTIIEKNSYKKLYNETYNFLFNGCVQKKLPKFPMRL